jgi:hypothetical protein
VSIILDKDEIWSTVLLCFLKPFCSSAKILLDSEYDESLLFKIEEYNLYMEQESAIPLYDNGSRGSFVLDLGMGVIITFPQSEGTIPFLKQILYRICKNETEQLFLKMSIGILSNPLALPMYERINKSK